VGKVFLCYRREDSGAHAGRVKDWLERDLGPDVVFMDVDDVPIGKHFVKVLTDQVARCAVLLAFIGKNWLDARDEDGNRRLDNPKDFVRIEIGSALQRDVPVIPILLDGARIPNANLLPKELEELSYRNGIDLRLSSFRSDVDRLLRGLKRELEVGAVSATTEIKNPEQPQEEPPKPIEAKINPSLSSAVDVSPTKSERPATVGKVTDATFEAEVLKYQGLVVVDFWADRPYGISRYVDQTLEEIAASLSGKIKIVKLNVDENRATFSQYDMPKIPTLLMFKNGRLLSRWHGAVKGSPWDWIKTCEVRAGSTGEV
jgi:thiol-disulfide isomerase/thioredoxin